MSSHNASRRRFLRAASVVSVSGGAFCGKSVNRSNWSSRMRAASPTAISGVTLPLVHTSSTSRSIPGSCFDTTRCHAGNASKRSRDSGACPTAIGIWGGIGAGAGCGARNR